MLRLLPPLYVVVEVLVFFLVGKWLGFGWAFFGVLVTPIIGVMLAGGAFRRLRQRIPSQRSAPKTTDTFTADMAVTVLTGALLVIPGIFTFILGLLMFLPPVRGLVSSLLGETLGLRVMTIGERFTRSRRTRTAAGDADATGADHGGPADWGEVIDHRSDEFGPDDVPGTGR